MIMIKENFVSLLRVCQIVLLGCFAKALIVYPAIADRATHWDQYQAGRNPLMELGLFVLGAVAVIGLLYALSKITEKN